MGDDKILIFPYVNGKLDALRVPSNVTIRDIIDHLTNKGTIPKDHVVIDASVRVDFNQPLNSFGIGNKTRIDIKTSTKQSLIEDVDPSEYEVP